MVFAFHSIRRSIHADGTSDKTTYYKYLNRKRIDHAMLLLSDPDIPVTEAALQSGFSSLSTFLRVFRSVKQCTPTEFRDMYIHPEKLQKNP